MLIKLSVVIITKNEAEMIIGCLKSIKNFADEIIIVDDFSTDETIKKIKLLKLKKIKIYQHLFKGFASQKNYGIKKCQGDWILLLDADERVSRKLADMIKLVVNSQQDKFVAFNIKFINYFLGKKMNFGGWNNEYHIRLFKNKNILYAQQEIHEYLKIKGEIKNLNAEIYHFSHRDLASNLLKTHLYAQKEAEYHYLRHSPQITKWSLCKQTIDHFYLRYIKEKGYQDGMEGLIEAMYQAFSYIFIIQSMLWEKQRGKDSQELYKELDLKLKANNFILD